MNPKRLPGLLLLLMMLIGSTLTAFAQEKTITGKVVSKKDNKPVAGVSIKVKNGTASAVTDVEGNFTIKVPSSESIISLTHVGYSVYETKVGDGTNLSISLTEVDNQLDDVVVVGYATQKKIHLTGAVETIKSSEFEDLPLSNVGAAIAGRVLGVGVSGGTTRPGSSATLTIRNPQAFSKDANGIGPLVVIDGMIQVDGNGQQSMVYFNSLDASEIESITFLKDASAAVYGSRGANGVMLVTTKKGKNGNPRISYSGSYAVNDEMYRTKMMSAYQFAMYMNIMNGPNGANRAAGVNNFFTQDELDYFQNNNVNYDWLDAAWKSSHNSRHSINISGGGNKATYFANVSYFTQDGNLSTLDFTRWNFRAGADVNVTSGFKTGLQVSGAFSDQVKTFNKIGGENDENDYRNLLLTPRYIPMYINGYAVKIPGTDQLSQYHYYEIQKLNNLAESKQQLMNVNIYAEYEIPFVKGLKTRLNYGRNFSSGNGSQVGTSYRLYNFTGRGTNGHIYDGATVNGNGTVYRNGDRLYYSNDNSQSYQVNWNLTYGRQFGKHDVSALFSIEKAESYSNQQDVWKESPLLTTNGQFSSAFGAIDGRTSGAESGSLGYIGRVNYNYNSKYMAEFLFRTDASTKFAPENYWGGFYSLSAGWVISNEKFFNNVKWVNFLKMRYSVGMLGKDDTKAWQWRQRYTYQNGKGLVLGGSNSANATTGLKMEASPNRNATWSDELKNNLGIEAKFLKNRLSLNVDGFYNKGDNLLIERTASTPVTVGGTVAAENWAKADFFGYEIGIGWSDKIGKDFNYGIDARFSWYDNKMTQGNFANILQPWDPQPGQSTDNGVWGYDYIGMFRTQEDIDAYVKSGISKMVSVDGNTSINAADFKPGMLYYRDIRGARQADGTYAAPDGIIDQNDRIQLAKKRDNHYGLGFTLRAEYKGIALNAVISGSFGGWAEVDGNARKKLNNDISRVFQSVPEIWGNIYDPVLNPTGDLPNPNWSDISMSPTSEFWRVSSFRLRLRNIALSYSLPKKIINAAKINGARFVFTAVNVLDFVNPYSYKAPDGAYDVYPDLRTFSFGLNVSF